MAKKVTGEFTVEVTIPSEEIAIENTDGGSFVVTAKGPTQKDAEDALKRFAANITQEA